METTPVTPVENVTPPSPYRVRNTFLTVICILSFVGSGWGIVKSIRDYAAADTIANIASGAVKNVESQMDQQNTPSFAKDIMNSVSEGLSAENIRKLAIMQLISNLLTLTGAILMWNLKKAGFYIYIVGIIVLVAAPLMIGKLVGIIGGTFSALIGVAFIVMYGVNLKHMNAPADTTIV